MRFLVCKYEIKVLMSNKQSKTQFLFFIINFHCVISFFIILNTNKVS